MGSARAVSAAVPSGRPPCALRWPGLAACAPSVARCWLEGAGWLLRRGPRLPTGRVPAGCVALSAGLALLWLLGSSALPCRRRLWLLLGCRSASLLCWAALLGCCCSAAGLLAGRRALLPSEPGRCRSSPAVASALLPPAGRCSLPVGQRAGCRSWAGAAPSARLLCCCAPCSVGLPRCCVCVVPVSAACLLLLGTWLCWLAGPCCAGPPVRRRGSWRAGELLTLALRRGGALARRAWCRRCSLAAAQLLCRLICRVLSVLSVLWRLLACWLCCWPCWLWCCLCWSAGCCALLGCCARCCRLGWARARCPACWLVRRGCCSVGAWAAVGVVEL